nr:piggyBac transposable element-derived protein 2-like [Onthophagus taurus]
MASSSSSLPSSILRQEAEVEEVGENLSDSDTDEEENISLAELQKRLRVQQIGKRKWRKRDINAEFPDWKATNNNAETTDEASTAIDFFELFFDAELVDKIVLETNRYSLQKKRALNVCTEEIKCFIGILLYSGYTQVPRRRMFWENASDAHHEIVINGMKRDRFEAILSHFYLANNYELDAEDKYAKIRPLVTMINEKFLCYAPIEEYYSFDESMCKYFGRHGLKQFIRGKPIRFGFKIWCGATRLGYVVNVDPYQGKNGYKEKDDLNLGLGGQLVYKFAKILKSQNPNPFHLFCDNFFTSIKLISELQKIGIRATGTIKENRSEHCPLLTKQNMKKESRGFYDYRVDESQELIVCKWNDNNVVSLCSNSVGINPVHSTTRFSRAERKRIQIAQPHHQTL